MYIKNQDESGYYYVTDNIKRFVAYNAENLNLNIDLIMMDSITATYSYMILLNDDAVEYYRINGFNMKKGQWYRYNDNGEVPVLEEYNGESPIKITDFTDEKIYSKSYLERLIASFNNNSN